MNPIRFTAQGEDDTDRLGAALARSLPDGAVLALSGTLGSGKTRLTQALAAACGVPRSEVVSPTFVLCQQYAGVRCINHFDAYRIQDDDEFLQLGPEEYFESEGLTVVEWAERVQDCLPAQHVRIDIEVLDEQRREFSIRAIGPAYVRELEQLRRLLSASDGPATE